MQTKTKLIFSAVIGVLIVTTFFFFINTNQGVNVFSPDFFRGVVDGIIFTPMVIWGIALIVFFIKRQNSKEKGEKLFSNKQFLLNVGMFCLFTGIFLSRIAGDALFLYFVSSILIGTSIVFNVTYFKKYRGTSA